MRPQFSPVFQDFARLLRVELRALRADASPALVRAAFARAQQNVFFSLRALRASFETILAPLNTSIFCSPHFAFASASLPAHHMNGAPPLMSGATLRSSNNDENAPAVMHAPIEEAASVDVVADTDAEAAPDASVAGDEFVTEAGAQADEEIAFDDVDEESPEEAPAPKAPDPAKVAFLAVLQRAKEGDVKAFEEIFQLYHRRIYNAVYGMLSDPDDAQDVTQDVFMRLHDALPTLRADEAFSTYLYRIALNLCRDRARRKKRVRFQSIDTPRTDDEGDAEPMDFPDQGKLPEETLTNEELQRRVREAVQTLSHDHKTVIVMHHFQGMEVNDIARILSVPTGTVKSRLARGRDQLHRKLRGYLNV